MVSVIVFFRIKKKRKEYATIKPYSSQQSIPGLGSLFPQIRKFRYGPCPMQPGVGGNEEGTDTQTHVHEVEVRWGMHTPMKQHPVGSQPGTSIFVVYSPR